MSNDDTGRTAGPTTTMKADGEIVSDATEDLGGGVKRMTLVVAWRSLPPTGAATTQTMIRTVTPTPNGEVIEIDMGFDPAVRYAAGTGQSQRSHMCCEFTHGELKGENLREDLLTISSEVDGVVTPKMTKRVLRPIRPTGVAALSTREQFQLGLELLNKHGTLPKGQLPGTLRILGDVLASEV